MSREIPAASFDECLDALDRVERRRLLNGGSDDSGVAFGELDVAAAGGLGTGDVPRSSPWSGWVSSAHSALPQHGA
ncbi:hypothetical protein [Halobellus ruber]|uniref:Uncharacterized protein n=1 Tax=Halobellus ruber TaxID=2761102 RepID=A0A7J9SDP1_9EURY|nr:hypothetical protein [Halobellus ruber]MBB6645020.1 hypothetical protein [Halobellus ruber]